MSELMLPEILESDEILLQQLSVEEAEDFYNSFPDFEVVYQYHEAIYQPSGSPRQWVSRMVMTHERIWTIRLADAPETIIGSCALHSYDKTASRIDIGGAVLPQYRCHLYSALAMALQAVREKQEVRVVVGKTTVKNQMAIDMAEKLGFLFIYAGKREAIVRWVI